jgi:hypothetical protein
MVLTAPLILMAMMAGCILSGTWIIKQPINFTAGTGFYFKAFDFSTSSVWEDHEDDIHAIDAVGALLYITSDEPDTVAFSMFVDEASGSIFPPASVPADARAIFEDVEIPPGVSKITYAESLTMIKNIDYWKTLALTGQFDVYVTSEGAIGETFTIDSGEVVVTFSAGK